MVSALHLPSTIMQPGNADKAMSSKKHDKKRKRASAEHKKNAKPTKVVGDGLEPDFSEGEEDQAGQPEAGPSTVSQTAAADLVQSSIAQGGDDNAGRGGEEVSLEASALDAYAAAVGASTSAAPTESTDFGTLNLAPATMKALQSMNITKMTPIQSKTISPLLAGKDVLGAAKTGSGKTLAFLLPAIEMLYRLRFKPRNGKVF